MPCCEIFIDGISVHFKVFKTAGKVSQKQDFIKFLETAIRGGDMIGLEFFAFTFLERQMGK